MEYSKEAKSLDDQLELLLSRGLLINDRPHAKKYLSNISYYRLSAYMLPFQNGHGDHKFIDGSEFQKILNIYLFDRELRVLVFDILERIEISFRTQMIYHYSLAYGPSWYEDPNHYQNNYHYSRNLAKLDEEIDRSSEVFIKHYKDKYSHPQRPPSWMVFELITMGLLSKIYRNLKTSPEKKKISKHFKVPNPYVLESWMQSITFVRNICAHHGRLWNRVLTLKPELLRKSDDWLKNTDIASNKLYAFLSCSLYLLHTINPTNSFVIRFNNLLEKYPQISLKAMGFPEGWEAEPIWKG